MFPQLRQGGAAAALQLQIHDGRVRWPCWGWPSRPLHFGCLHQPSHGLERHFHFPQQIPGRLCHWNPTKYLQYDSIQSTTGWDQGVEQPLEPGSSRTEVQRDAGWVNTNSVAIWNGGCTWVLPNFRKHWCFICRDSIGKLMFQDVSWYSNGNFMVFQWKYILYWWKPSFPLESWWNSTYDHPPWMFHDFTDFTMPGSSSKTFKLQDRNLLVYR